MSAWGYLGRWTALHEREYWLTKCQINSVLVTFQSEENLSSLREVVQRGMFCFHYYYSFNFCADAIYMSSLRELVQLRILKIVIIFSLQRQYIFTWRTSSTKCVLLFFSSTDGFYWLFFSFLISVNFDHFQILRAIGKGSFGKVRLQRLFDFCIMCIGCFNPPHGNWLWKWWISFLFVRFVTFVCFPGNLFDVLHARSLYL